MAEPLRDERAMRVDRFLWYARLARTRSAAQALVAKGMLRIDGRRIERAHALVRVGAVLAFPLGGQVRVLRVEALPKRRGPPTEAATLYTTLETAAPNPVDENRADA